MTKILLINPAIRKHERPINFPIGAGIIANIMLQNNFEVVAFDHNAMRYDNSTMVSELKKIKDVAVVGIGGMITIYSYLKGIIPTLREIFPLAKIVVGGGVTIEPDVVFENIRGVDFCVHGEGEHTFLELCNHLRENKTDFENINGISFMKEQQLYRTRERNLEMNLDVFPMPAYQLFPTEIYLGNTRFNDGYKRQATLITSRGCPNKCTFCWRMTGRGVRFRSIENVLQEIQYLKSNYDIDSMFLLDEAINASERRLTYMCNSFIENRVNLSWVTHARADKTNPEILKLMKEAGCIRLSVGIESGSAEMLKAMNKNVTPEQNKRAIILMKQSEVKIHASMMVGMPGETRKTVDQSIALLAKAKPDTYSYSITTPYPGCELYYLPEAQKQILERYGSKDRFFENLGDIIDLTINLTDFSDEELIRLRNYAQYKSCPKMIRLTNKVKAIVFRTVKYILPQKLYMKLKDNSLILRIVR